MNSEKKFELMRGATLKSMDQTAMLFKISLVLCGLAELAGLVAVFWFIDWSEPTHRLIFAATMLVWVNLALWVWTLAVRSRIGEQRILRAIEVLAELDDNDGNNTK